MSSLKNLGRVALALTATSLASALLVAACSSDTPNPAPTVYGNDGGNDATTGGGDDGSPDGATTNPDGPGTPDASPDSTPNGGDAGDAGDAVVDSAPSCTAVLSDAGCWTCPAQSDGSVEFLNQCSGTGVTCVSFDNLGRLPGFDAGLPHL